MSRLKRITDDKQADERARMALCYLKFYPCAICSGEAKDHTCVFGVKYRGTCKVYKRIKERLWGSNNDQS